MMDAIRQALAARLAESHPSAIDIQPFGHETSEPWPGQQPTANALAEAIAEMATNDRWGLIQRVRAIIVRDRATVRARWEKHPSAIRAAVEGEREACAKIAEDAFGDGPSSSYDNGATSDGFNIATRQIAAAIRAPTSS